MKKKRKRGRGARMCTAATLALTLLLPLAPPGLADTARSHSGQAVAVLEQDGTLRLTRVEGSVEEGADQTITDVCGATYQGTVWAGVESLVATQASDVPWDSAREEVTSFVVARGVAVSPMSLAWWFQGCTALTEVDLAGVDASGTTSLAHAFQGCTALMELDLQGLDTSSVTDMTATFERCDHLLALDVSPLDLSSVTLMGDGTGEGGTFSGLDRCERLILGDVDTSQVTNMHALFAGCASLTTVDVSGLDTGSVTDLGSLFASCTSLTSLDLSSMDTSAARDVSALFMGDFRLASLDLSGADMRCAQDLFGMFGACASLSEVKLGTTFSFSGMAPRGRWACLPTPPSTPPYSGTWYRDWLAETEVTAEDLRDSWVGESMAGTWRWLGLCEGEEFALSFDLAGGSLPDDTSYPSSYVAGTSLPLPGTTDSLLPGPTRPGHTFLGWLDEGGDVTETIGADSRGPRTYTASWQPLQIRISVPVCATLIARPSDAGGLELRGRDADFTLAVTNEGEAAVTARATTEATGALALTGASPNLFAGEACVWFEPTTGTPDEAKTHPPITLPCPRDGASIVCSIMPAETLWLNGLAGRIGPGTEIEPGLWPLLTIHWTFTALDSE